MQSQKKKNLLEQNNFHDLTCISINNQCRKDVHSLKHFLDFQTSSSTATAQYIHQETKSPLSQTVLVDPPS